MNILDVIVVLTIVLFMYIGYRRGLIKTVYNLISYFISIALTGQLYPFVSKFLRNTPVYDSLKTYVINSMGLEAHFQTQTERLQNDLIKALPLPDMLKDSLLANNTPDIYQLFNVKTIEEYIGGYFANIALNIISMIVVFLLVQFIMRSLSRAIDLIGRLPVISTFNHAGGLAAGLAMGVLIVWVGLALMDLLLFSPSHPEWFDKLQASLIARWLYEHNIFFSMVTKTH